MSMFTLQVRMAGLDVSVPVNVKTLLREEMLTVSVYSRLYLTVMLVMGDPWLLGIQRRTRRRYSLSMFCANDWRRK